MNISELSDIQAESCVIGSLIFHPEYILNSESFLKPKHFYNTENGCIYWAINSLVNEGIENIDALNLSNKLKSNPKVSNTMDKYNIPSVQEFVDLYKELARNTVEEYLMLAKTITEYAFRRTLYKKMNILTNKCFDKDISLDELSGDIYSGIDEVTSEFILGSDTHLLGDDLDSIWADIVARRTEDGLYGLPSKFPSCNKFFTYETGELVIVQGMYKSGKSTFVLNEIVHKLKNGVPTLIVETENSTRLFTIRLISHLSQVSIDKVKSGKCTDEENQRIEDAKSWIKKQKFKHIYKPDISDNELYAICKLWINKIGIRFFVFDTIKSHEGDTGVNYNALGRKTDFLHNKIAGELNLAVLATCQLNRGGEVADSVKINQHLSVGIKYGQKTQEQQIEDGVECGNAYAKVYVNRIGKETVAGDDDDYIDLYLDGDTSTITEVKQHSRQSNF